MNGGGIVIIDGRHPDIFIVVKVHSGIPELVEAFRDESAADRCATKLKVDINPEYDEVEVFQAKLH